VRGLFVTGTDTGVGKSVLSACLLASMRAAGAQVRAFKPVVTGVDEPPDAPEERRWPSDDVLLAWAAGMRPEEVSPLRYGPAVSPHLAARLAGEAIDETALIAAARGGAGEQEIVIVEGVGGLLVPLRRRFSVCDLAGELGLPVLIAARPGLGTINHTLLTLHAARAAGLRVDAVVLTPWPERAAVLERSNRETIEAIGEVEVAVLKKVGGPDRDALARAGEELPWRRWLAPLGRPHRREHPLDDARELLGSGHVRGHRVDQLAERA
jgi:dethiobiotin synthetase